MNDAGGGADVGHRFEQAEEVGLRGDDPGDRARIVARYDRSLSAPNGVPWPGAPSQEALARAFIDRNVGLVLGALDAEGKLRVDRPSWAAGHLMGMIEGDSKVLKRVSSGAAVRVETA